MAIATATKKASARGDGTARSRKALTAWAAETGWRLAFLEPGAGNGRRGIVDAVLVRASPHDPDAVQVKLVQLRGGKAGLAPAAERRLERAAERVEIEVLHVFHDENGLCFSAPFLPAWHPERRRSA
jgi:hypothetical protein